MRKIKIGIIGCGTIGSILAIKINKDTSLPATVHYLADVDEKKVRSLQKKLSRRVRVASNEIVIQKSDFVIEAASAHAALSIAQQCLKKNKDVLIMSIGGLVKGMRTLMNLAHS